MLDIFSGLSAAAVAFASIVFLLWVALPFAVFGIKRRIDKGITELKLMNKKLTKLHTCLVLENSRTTRKSRSPQDPKTVALDI